MYEIPGWQVTLGCLLHWSLKFYDKVFLLVGSVNFRIFIELELVGLSSWVKSIEGVILCCDDLYKCILSLYIPGSKRIYQYKKNSFFSEAQLLYIMFQGLVQHNLLWEE